MTPRAITALLFLRQYKDTRMWLYALGFTNAIIDSLHPWERMYLTQVIEGKA